MYLAWFSNGPGRSRPRTHFVVRVCGLERPGPSESQAMMLSCIHCFFFSFLISHVLNLLIMCGFLLCGLYIQEEKKGKLPTGLVLQSFSFFSNISISISFFLALLCSPSDYWEVWVSGLVLMITWLQWEYFFAKHTCQIQQVASLTSCIYLFLLFLDFTCHYFVIVSETRRYSVHPWRTASVRASLTCRNSFGCVYVP